MRMRDELEQKVGLRFSKGLMAADNKEIYLALLELVQEKLAAAKQIQGRKSCTTSPRNSWWANCCPTT